MPVKSKQTSFRPLFLLLLCLLLSSGEASCSAAEKTIIKGQVTANIVLDALDMTGVKCALKPGSSPTLLVEEARIGRAAYNAGLQKDDVIRDVRATPDGYKLLIERAGAQYQIAVRSSAAATALQGSAFNTNLLTSLGTQGANVQLKPALVGKTDNSLHKLSAADKKAPVLQGTARQKQEDKRILEYNIEFVIDISGSMASPDGTDGLSKFDWCREQVASLADRLTPYARTVDITVFNDRYQTAESCNRDTISAIYSGIKPGGGTALATPLLNRCEAALAKRQAGGRPTLIAVITDGLPGDRQAVYQNLITFTQKLSRPDDVVVTILQIGENFGGQGFCVDLDDNLVANGAKYDIIDTRTFEELRAETMPTALIHALENIGKKSDHAVQRPGYR
jgi:Mg-chelatase subunit ChlD